MTCDRIHISKWMDQAASGDDAAFGHLADAVQDDLYRFALAQGLRADDAADAVQETLLRAYDGRRRWRGGEAMTWLWGICTNVVREMRRRRRGQPVQGLDLEIQATRADAAPAGEPDLAALAAAIERLPARQREALARPPTS